MTSVDPPNSLEVLLTRGEIEFAEVVQRVPADVQEEARVQLESIAESLRAVPRAHVFRKSLGQSRLCLIVRGWSFYYEVDDQMLRVTYVHQT